MQKKNGSACTKAMLQENMTVLDSSKAHCVYATIVLCCRCYEVK